jgi:phosphocarrier protein HPr
VYARRVTIANATGLHVRPATLFMEAASRFRSIIHVTRGDRRVDGKSAIGLMLLEALPGTEVTIEATGEDEQDAVDALVTLVERQFEEVPE